jgi:putative ABC transport system substrate-binding protein
MALPFAAHSQQKRMPVIGYLNPTSPGPAALNVAAFRQGLSETGYIEGQSVVIEYRWAEVHHDRLPALAADLVGRRVDVITASGDAAVLAAKRATSTIPTMKSPHPRLAPEISPSRPRSLEGLARAS